MNLPGSLPGIGEELLWGSVATAVITVILYGSQFAGLSRLSLPFLVGTCLTGNRDWAAVLGLLVYLVGGLLFTALYAMAFAVVGATTWWLGALVGLVHALFLLAVVLPVLPHFHPRMASEYDGPVGRRRLEPPGFLGLNYGYRTPLTTLLGHIVFGIILGAFT